MINGVRVFTSDYCVDHIPAKTHRKRRINKKWLKRYGFKQVPSKNIFVVDGVGFLMHPHTARKLEDLRDE